MPVDQNIYALSIQLALEAQSAFDTLDDFGQKVTDLEEEVSSAAQKAIQNLGQIAEQASQHLSGIGKLLTDIDARTLKVETNLGGASKELKDQFNTGEDRLEDLEEELKLREKTFKLQEDLGKELQTHLDLNTEFLALTNKVIGAVKQKNAGHQEQNGLLRNDVDLGEAFNKTVGNTTNKVNDLNKEAGKFAISWRTVWGWVKKVDEDTEKFITTNFRYYGSQQQLVQGARELAIANGIAYENAVEAYAVMGNLKVPREELDKYAKVVSQVNRITGVGIQVAGEYVNRLRSAGLSLAGAERNLSNIGEAMRKFGLNTRDVNALMNQSAGNAKNVSRIFSRTGDELQKWEKSRMVLAGFAREAGHSADELAGFENWILNDVAALEVFTSTVNVGEQTVDGFRVALLRQGIQAEQTMAALEARQRNGENIAAEMLGTQNTLINTYFGGSRAAYEAARAQGRLAMQNNLTGQSIEDVNRLTEIYTNTLDNQMAEANNTFTAQMRILWSTITAASMSVMQFIADALLPLVKALNWLLSEIATVVGWVADFVRWMEEIPVLGKAVTFIKWTVGVLGALGLAFIFASGAIASFSAVLGGFGGLMVRMTAGVQAFANIILTLVSALGKAIVIVLTSIGQGLQMLGNLIKGVIVPLLALGAAFLMTGIGAYFFAMGVQVIAEMGWAAIPAIFGMIAAIAILGGALVFIATFVQGPIALGLVVLGTTFLMIGLAAYLAGQGLSAVGDGLQKIAEVASVKLLLFIGGLALAVGTLGLVSVVAAPGLLFLGLALGVLGTALRLITGPMQAFASFTTEFGVVVEKIGTAITTIVGVLVNGIRELAAAAPSLSLAAGALLNGGILLLPAAVSLLAAATLLAPGAWLLAAAASNIMAGGTDLNQGAPLLLSGASALQAGVDALREVNGLFRSVTLLLPGATLLQTLGISIAIGGAALAAGAAALLVGAENLAKAAPLLELASPSLLKAVTSLLVIAGSLSTAAFALMAGSVPLVTASLAIFVAGLALSSGAIFLVSGLQIMLAIPDLMRQVSAGVVSGVASLTAGMLLLAAVAPVIASTGVVIMAGGAALFVGMWLLSAAAVQTLVVGALIGVGGTAMLAGVQQVLQAAELMQQIGWNFVRSAIRLSAATSILFIVAAGILIVGAGLVAAAVVIGSAALSLLFNSYLLIIGAGTLSAAAIVLFGAASMSLTAAVSLSLAISILSSAAAEMRSIIEPLARGGRDLTIVAGILSESSYKLADASVLLLPASARTSRALRELSGSFDKFKGSADAVHKVGTGLESMAVAFRILNSAPADGFLRAADATKKSLPVLEEVGDQLVVAAGKLTAGVDAFQRPAERLNAILRDLTSTITAFGEGLNLSDDVGRLAGMLENYANLLENASYRIETAVTTKAMPAIRAAEQAGIEETIRSEAINTVQIMDKTDGEARDSQDEMSKQLIKLNETMVVVKDTLVEIASGGNGELSEIVAILQAYLPGINKGDTGLGSELNSWAR